MPVPISISELSTTPGSNSPSGSDSPSVLDDHQRTAYAFIRTLSDAKLDASSGVTLTGNQTIAGTKTFSSPIAGSVTGSAASITGTNPIANGGTGATTAAAAFTAIKQAATDTATGVVELATDAEAQAGTDATRAVTPDNLGAVVLGLGQTWQNLTGSRALGTTYTNSTGRTIFVCVTSNDIQGVTRSLTATVSGVTVSGQQGYSPSGNIGLSLSFAVPPGQTYSVAQVNSTLSAWSELR